MTWSSLRRLSGPAAALHARIAQLRLSLQPGQFMCWTPRLGRAAGPGLPLLAWLIRACDKCRALTAVRHSPACPLPHSALAGLADVLARQEPTPEQLAALQVLSSWGCVQSPLTLAAAGVSPHGCP